MKRILIVEDEPWMGECYKIWLKRAGYQVLWVRSAQQALDELAEEVPHLILLDIFLGEANGVQLLHQLATYTPRVPVIVFSTSLPADVDWRGYGVAATLDKTTLTPISLRQTVREVLHAGSVAH